MNQSGRARRVFAGMIAALLWTSAAFSQESLSPAIREIVDQARFKHAHFGLLVADLATGEVLYESNADKLFAPASTTKLYSVASALEHLGADHRFRTPIYRRGELSEGTLQGDLILVAVGDLTLGGRTDEQGHIAFTNHDHTYANGSSNTELTAPNPLAGLDQLAQQVAEAGIRKVLGEIIIDDRLFDRANSSGSGPRQVSPILVNDNLIDITVTPGTAGAAAQVEWRPHGSFFTVENKVTTSASGRPNITIRSRGDKLIVSGQIPADHAPVIHVHEVDAPADWARGLLIDALRRAEIDVAASAEEPNPASQLPSSSDYAQLERVAEFESPPFAENARLILKVSHNLHASTLPLLVAAQAGKRSLSDGFRLQRKFLDRVGVEAETISFGGGAGGEKADYTTPRANVQLLRHLSTRPDFEVFHGGLPVLGVDGTLHEAVPEDSPARGQAQAKTGTLYWYNALNDRYLLVSKALAGYLTAKSGRPLAFSFVVGNVHLTKPEERNEIGKVLGSLCEVVYDEL